MKQHRVFLSINLPEKFKGELMSVRSGLYDIPGRWTKKEQLHVTVQFLGNLRDEHLPELIEVLQQVGEKTLPFALHFNEISYGPDSAHPRMIWARGEESKEFLNLQRDMKRVLASLPFRVFPSRVETRPHITLVRIHNTELRESLYEDGELPTLETVLDYRLPVHAIDLMESKLHRGGPEHFVLQSIPLQG